VNRHKTFEQILAARGTLTHEEREHLADHRAGCPSCQQRAEAYDRQDRFLQALRLDVPPRSALPAVLASPAPVTPRLRRYRSLLTPLRSTRTGLPRRMVSFAILAILALAIVTGAVYAAGSIIQVYHPEDRGSPGSLSRLFYTPALPPYPTVHYRSLDPHRAARTSGYAVAYIQTPPRDISTAVGVDIVPHVGWPKQSSGPRPTDPSLQGLAVAIRSVVRYHGGDHTVIVLLNEPSPTAIETRELILGQHTVHLPGGQEAWASADQSSAVPFIQPRPSTAPYAHAGLPTMNMLAWVEGHYVVSLWSDLSEARLRQLAATTAVVPPNPIPSQRGIPSTWPTPLPLDRLPARLQAVASGGATYQLHGTTLNVAYLFNFTSYSEGALYGLDQWHNVSVTITFPSALQRRTKEPIPHQTVPGGNFGTGGAITFKVAGMAPGDLARALRQGGTIRLAWTEHQQRRRQTFHFPLTAGSCSQVGMNCATPASG
jgi:hypothetical protein